MYDLIVTLPTEICDLCSVSDFSVVCAGLLVSLFSPGIYISGTKISYIFAWSPVFWTNS